MEAFTRGAAAVVRFAIRRRFGPFLEAPFHSFSAGSDSHNLGWGMGWPKPAHSACVRLASEAITSNYWGLGPASRAVVASGTTVLALGPATESGSTAFVALAPATEAGPTAFAWVPDPTLEPAVPMLEPTFLALGRGLASGAMPALGAILTLGPTVPIERAPPRWAKHMPVSKLNNMPQRITFFIYCPPLFRCLPAASQEGLPI